MVMMSLPSHPLRWSQLEGRGGGGCGSGDGDAASVPAHLHAKVHLQEQRCASAGNAGTP
jgi:hypothetical protein